MTKATGPGDPLTTENAATLPACTSAGCYNTGRYGAAVFHPGHGSTCPRYVPNSDNFCADCGTSVHYRPHAPWCVHALSPTAPRDALRTFLAKAQRDAFCDCPGAGLPDDQHAPDGCHGLEVAAALLRSWTATQVGGDG